MWHRCRKNHDAELAMLGASSDFVAVQTKRCVRSPSLRHRQAESISRCARLDVVGLGRPEPRADGLTAKPDGLETAAVER